MQTRHTRAELTAYTLHLRKRTIPANAVLHDFRVGPGHEGLASIHGNAFRDVAAGSGGVRHASREEGILKLGRELYQDSETVP
jgi:hypothetical protein